MNACSYTTCFIKLINSKMKMVTNECLFMYHLLYQINKFKKDIWRQIISYSFIAFQFIVYNSFQFIFGNQMNSPTTIERIQYAFVGQSSIYFSVCQDVLLLLGVGLDAIY